MCAELELEVLVEIRAGERESKGGMKRERCVKYMSMCVYIFFPSSVCSEGLQTITPLYQ